MLFEELFGERGTSFRRIPLLLPYRDIPRPVKIFVTGIHQFAPWHWHPGPKCSATALVSTFPWSHDPRRAGLGLDPVRCMMMGWAPGKAGPVTAGTGTPRPGRDSDGPRRAQAHAGPGTGSGWHHRASSPGPISKLGTTLPT